MNQANRKKAVKTPQQWLGRLIIWSLTAGCFYLVYGRTEQAAAREGKTLFDFVADFFAGADWLLWLSCMIPYSIFFFLVDAHATWRVVRWFNSKLVRYGDMLPIRASAYILSLVNEQIGKGAMTLYLLRRHAIPGWQALSSMILLGMVEIYQLLIFSAVGVFLYYDLVLEASSLIPLNQILITVFIVAGLYFPLHLMIFRSRWFANFSLRDRDLLTAFRQARALDYLLVLLCKAPNLILAVVVYTVSLNLFDVPVEFGQMLAFLPVIFIAAALPLPFHAGALVLWTVLFPEYPEVGIFSLVMHTFFVSFNAVIGLLFLPMANRQLFDEAQT
jgi:hypothetical protein